MKKIFLFILSVFLAYLTAFYVIGPKNGYKDPFAFNQIFNFSNSVISSDKNDVLKEGLKNLKISNYEDALENFQNALEKENTDETNYYVGYTYLQIQDYENALYYLEKACNLNSKNSNAWLQKGITEYYQKKYQDAINDLFFCTEMKEEESEAYYYLALCYEAQGKNEVALQSAETAVQYDSLDSDSWYKAAYLAFNINNFRKAINYYHKVLEIIPKDKYSLLNLGLAYDKNGNKDSALIWYNQVIKDYPDYSLAYNNKGYLFQKEGNCEAAVSYYSQAIKLDPESTFPLWNRGNSYFILKEYEKAITDYKKIYELNPDYYNTLYQIGESFENLEQKENALRYYKKFKAVASSDNKFFIKATEKIKNLQ